MVRESTKESVAPPRWKWAASAADLARAMDVTPAAVTQWRKRDDWIFGQPPYPIKLVKAWRQFIGRRNTAGDELDDEYKRRRNEKIAAETRRLRGLYMEREVFERAAVGLVEQFLRELGDAVQTLPQRIQGLDAGEIERHLAERVELIRERLEQKAVIELTTTENVQKMRRRRS